MTIRSNDNYDPNRNILVTANRLSNNVFPFVTTNISDCNQVSIPSTTNGLPLSDITNIVSPSNETRYRLPNHAVGPSLNSSQPTQVRRRVSRPRLSERPITITRNATNTTPRRRGRPPTRVVNPLPNQNITQLTPRTIVSWRTIIDTNGNPVHLTETNTINQCESGDYEFQPNVTEDEEKMMDEVQWGGGYISTTCATLSTTTCEDIISQDFHGPNVEFEM